MITRLSSLLLVVLVLGLALARPVSAGPPTDALKLRIDLVLQTLNEPGARPDQRRAALRKVAAELFDWEEMAKQSLGAHWRERARAEREEFVRLFGDLLERSFMRSIDRYNGEKVAYLGESIDGDRAVVRTKIVAKAGTEVPLGYHLLRRDDGAWRIYDVDIEGVSLVGNYRTQFNNALRRDSYEALVVTMRSKTGGPDPEAAASTPRRTW